MVWIRSRNAGAHAPARGGRGSAEAIRSRNQHRAGVWPGWRRNAVGPRRPTAPRGKRFDKGRTGHRGCHFRMTGRRHDRGPAAATCAVASTWVCAMNALSETDNSTTHSRSARRATAVRLACLCSLFPRQQLDNQRLNAVNGSCVIAHSRAEQNSHPAAPLQSANHLPVRTGPVQPGGAARCFRPSKPGSRGGTPVAMYKPSGDPLARFRRRPLSHRDPLAMLDRAAS